MSSDDDCRVIDVRQGSSSTSMPPPDLEDEQSTSNIVELSSQQKPKSREIYEFIIRCCIRLKALNRTSCMAILLMHRLYDRELVKYICNYVGFHLFFVPKRVLLSLATTCVLIAVKKEEDSSIKIRDVLNCSYRILHPEDPLMDIDEEFWSLRRSLGRLEFVILRELAFEINYEHPHQLLAIYLNMLESWMPEEFKRFAIKEEAFAVLRDCYVIPEFILEHSHESIALTVLSLVLKGHDLSVPFCRDFFKIFSKRMTEKKLRSLEEEIVQDVYRQRLK